MTFLVALVVMVKDKGLCGVVRGKIRGKAMWGRRTEVKFYQGGQGRQLENSENLFLLEPRFSRAHPVTLGSRS